MSDITQAPDLGKEQISEKFGQKIASYIKETDELITDLRQENAQLKEAAGKCPTCGESCSDCECPQKKASEGAVEEGRITEVVDHLIQAGFLKESSRDQAITAVNENPANALLNFCDKLASQQSPSQKMPVLGKPVAKPGQESGAAPTSESEKRASDKSFEATFDNLNIS